MPSDPLDGQVVLVTGGGRGIGASIARELAGAGARVAVSARSKDEVEAVASEVDGLAVVADVSKREDVEQMVAEVESSLGPLDLLVANAGVGGPDGSTWELDPAEWWHVQEINVLGVHLCCRTVIPGMLERGRGRIVITASGAAYLPGSSSTAYPTSKAAVARYGETLANELRGRIPVFFFSPGLVQTEMTSGFGRRPRLDAAGAGAAARARARLGARGRTRRPVHPRGARRHRGSDLACRRGRRERPERDQAAALGAIHVARALASGRPSSP